MFLKFVFLVYSALLYTCNIQGTTVSCDGPAYMYVLSRTQNGRRKKRERRYASVQITEYSYVDTTSRGHPVSFSPANGIKVDPDQVYSNLLDVCFILPVHDVVPYKTFTFDRGKPVSTVGSTDREARNSM